MLEFVKMGVSFQHIHLIGKCYSTNPLILTQMLSEGFNVSPSSVSFENDEPFDIQYTRYLARFLQKTLKKIDPKKFRKIIILDDGGDLILQSQEILKDCSRLVGIEQTTSGYEKLKKSNLKFPIINVARSETKLIYESPIIAKLVVDKIYRSLKKLSLKPKNVLLIGNGAIGQNIHRFLIGHLDIQVYDKNECLSNVTGHDFKNILKNFDMIIGCTGREVISDNDYHLLKKNAVLASASSSDREFDAGCVRKGLKPSSCHSHLLINGINLLNCGFPINFDDDYSTVDSEHFQLTRSLLSAAIFQASELDVNEPGILMLDPEMQRDIIAKFLKLYQTDDSQNSVDRQSYQTNYKMR